MANHANQDTVIVAAAIAWPEYQRFGAYVCQAERFFRPVRYFGFYAEGAVQPLIARPRLRRNSVAFTHEEADRRRAAGEAELADLIDLLVDHGAQRDVVNDVHLLTPPDDPQTVRLPRAIPNDKVGGAGGDRPVAWTQNQRYTTLDRLRTARVTSDLEPHAG